LIRGVERGGATGGRIGDAALLDNLRTVGGVTTPVRRTLYDWYGGEYKEGI